MGQIWYKACMGAPEYSWSILEKAYKSIADLLPIMNILEKNHFRAVSDSPKINVCMFLHGYDHFLSKIYAISDFFSLNPFMSHDELIEKCCGELGNFSTKNCHFQIHAHEHGSSHVIFLTN